MPDRAATCCGAVPHGRPGGPDFRFGRRRNECLLVDLSSGKDEESLEEFDACRRSRAWACAGCERENGRNQNVSSDYGRLINTGSCINWLPELDSNQQPSD